MLKAMIVDDEAPARSELRFLLDETGQTEVVAEAGSVREAIEKLKEFPCDVIFLDINMPEATGLQLADALRHLKFPPAVVFVTAYSEHALDSVTDSRPCSYVGLKWASGEETWGCGTHTDIIVAGIKALVSAINNK